ncbi:hypothetical protein [Streptomyces sp. L-9-10]|uniref:hypothetical protein n=1 Tax=Streptomyces sp. L-9-10 TaxID=1478131 RepID=UPI0013EDFDFE|nr:hypothetical protein [Streptomyces sp. L-9-10]
MKGAKRAKSRELAALLRARRGEVSPRQLLTIAQERDQFLVVMPASDEDSGQRLRALGTP